MTIKKRKSRIASTEAFILAAVIFLCSFLAACRAAGPRQGASPSGSTPAPPTPSPGSTWQLSFGWTGGIAGISQALLIGGEGRTTWTDHRQNQEIELEITQDELATLERVLKESEFFTQRTPQTQPCVDCFNYRVTLLRDEDTHTVEANDIGLEESLKPLIRWLSELADSAQTRES